MKRLLHRFLCLVLGLAAPFAAYCFVALITAFVPRAVADVDGAQAEREVILAAGVIHYDILLPLDGDTRAAFAFAQDAGVPVDDETMQWLSVGWGSEAFYTQTGTYGDISLGTTWRAATGDAGAMRIEVYGPLPEHPKLRRVMVSETQLDALRSAVLDDLGAAPQTLDAPGFSETDAFFEAAGRFNAFRTCNTWVGATLAQAGLAMGAWTPTPYAITLSLRLNGHLSR